MNLLTKIRKIFRREHLPTEKSTSEAIPQHKLLVASQWQLIRWKFVRHKVALTSLIIIIVLYIMVIFAGFFSPYDPRKTDTGFVYCPPTKLHWVDEQGTFHLTPFVYGFTRTLDRRTLLDIYVEDKERIYPLKFFVKGDPYPLFGMTFERRFMGVEEEGRLFVFGTDKMGRDLLSRILYGGRVSLSIGLAGIAISTFLGILIGGISGYVGGTTDIVIQRIIEFLRSIPTLPLWMGLSAALPPQWGVVEIYFGIVLILSLVGWTGLARVVRGKFMALKAEDFVMAARLHGAGEARIIFKHLLPSFYSHIIASLTLAVPGMILGETALSFIGLGMQAPAISWGVLLKDAQSLMALSNARWLLTPGAWVILVILAFNFVGDGLRDAADPYTQ